MSEKLRQIMEIKLTQKRLGELPRLLDSDLFLASLKKPEAVKGNLDTELTSVDAETIDVLKELVKLYNKASEVLMEIEGFFRENLASNITHINVETHTEVERVVDKIKELQDKLMDIFGDIEYYAEALRDENFNLYLVPDFNEVLKDIRYSLFSVFSHLKEYLLNTYNLFSLDHFSESILSKPKSLYELADEARKAGLLEAASDIEKLAKDIGLVLLDPDSFKILLDGNKVKRLYLTIKNRYEEFLAQYGRWSTHYPILENVINELWNLKYSISEFLSEAVKLVRVAYALRSIVSELGYKSPSQRLTFFLPPVDAYIITEDMLPNYIPDELTFSSLFNDIAYVVHRVAEMLIFYTSYLNNVLGISDLQVFKLKDCHVPLFSRISSGSLLNFGIAWLNTVCALMDGWITYEDKDSLTGYIISDTTAWFRVGSAMGHAMHVRKEGDTWIINYYDTDKPVNNTLAKLLRAIPGVEVEVWNKEPRQEPTGIDLSNSGLIIRTKDDKALPFIGAILGFASSMDINIRDLGRDVYDAIVKYAEEISPQLALIAKAAFGSGK